MLLSFGIILTERFSSLIDYEYVCPLVIKQMNKRILEVEIILTVNLKSYNEIDITKVQLNCIHDVAFMVAQDDKFYNIIRFSGKIHSRLIVGFRRKLFVNC